MTLAYTYTHLMHLFYNNLVSQQQKGRLFLILFTKQDMTLWQWQQLDHMHITLHSAR